MGATIAPKTSTRLTDTFRAADYLRSPSKYTVLDVAGNNYRLIAVIYFDSQKMYIRHVLTHAEYDKWTKENRRK